VTKNKYSRVKKLEEKTSIGERCRVMPLCCFYIGDEAKTCNCKPYFTRTPRVIGMGMDTFYKMAKLGNCEPIPSDAEFIEEETI